MNTWKATVMFRDENMPDVSMDNSSDDWDEGIDTAKTNLSILFNRYASLKSGQILDPKGNKHVYSSRGEYLFTVPANIIQHMKGDQ